MVKNATHKCPRPAWRWPIVRWFIVAIEWNYAINLPFRTWHYGLIKLKRFYHFFNIFSPIPVKFGRWCDKLQVPAPLVIVFMIFGARSTYSFFLKTTALNLSHNLLHNFVHLNKQTNMCAGHKAFKWSIFGCYLRQLNRVNELWRPGRMCTRARGLVCVCVCVRLASQTHA